MIDRMTIRIPQADLLSAIWYSDGSGARGIHDLGAASPRDFEIESITLDGDDCLLVLVPRSEAPRG